MSKKKIKFERFDKNGTPVLSAANIVRRDADWFDEDEFYEDDYDEEPVGYVCMCCGYGSGTDTFDCPRCCGPMDAYY